MCRCGKESLQGKNGKRDGGNQGCVVLVKLRKGSVSK